MNFKFAEKINPALSVLDFERAAQIAATEIAKLTTSDFHAVVDMTFTGQVEVAANWINNFYQTTSRNNRVKALYLEMNEFDINTNMWYFSGFSYMGVGGFDSENIERMDWLCDYDDSTTDVFKLKGLEKIQIAFSKVEEREEIGDWTEELQNTMDWCEQIVIIKFMELMREVHFYAKKNGFLWAQIPIYFTEHGYDFIVKSEIE